MTQRQANPGPALSRRALLKMMAAGSLAGLAPFSRLLASGHTLRQRPVPSSGELLPAVGLGTSRVFDVGSDEQARAPLAEVLKLMVEHGGSVVDTSPMYGRAEGVVGDLSEADDLRQRLFIATKVWTPGREQGIAQMEESFKLLRVESVDLMQVHNLVDWQTQIKTLRRWKEEGRIRYLGVTHYRVDAFDELEAVIRAEPLDFVQLNYSIATPEAEQRLLPLAAERGVAVLINRPYERGETFARVRGKTLPAMGRGVRRFQLGTILFEVDTGASRRDLRDPRHIATHPYAGQSAGRHGCAARRGSARAYAGLLSRLIRDSGCAGYDRQVSG